MYNKFLHNKSENNVLNFSKVSGLIYCRSCLPLDHLNFIKVFRKHFHSKQSFSWLYKFEFLERKFFWMPILTQNVSYSKTLEFFSMTLKKFTKKI